MTKALLRSTCATCKWCYTYGSGYSNWTWESTHPACALNQIDFAAEVPYDWEFNVYHESDNWPVTNAARCTKYEARPWPMIEFDVDGETYNTSWPHNYWVQIAKHHWGDMYEHSRHGQDKPARPTRFDRSHPLRGDT